MERSAVFSPCRTYRYALWRVWERSQPYVMFIGLNPSTADETQDDPTIRRCIAYAKDWGFGGLCMTNLFAYRATDPAVMKAASDPVGPENDSHLVNIARVVGMKLACWGVHGGFNNRQMVVCRFVEGLHILRLTRDGFPAHPLYLPKSLTPVVWNN